VLAERALAVLRRLARQIGLNGGVETLRHLQQWVKRVVSHVHLGALVIPEVSLTGLTEDTRRLLGRIGVSLPEPTGAVWVAVRLDAGKGVQRRALLALVASMVCQISPSLAIKRRPRG